MTERELNRALLARQLLLERVDLPPTRAIERVGGLQTQYAPSGYIGLWSRIQHFERDALTRALERRTAVQAWLMRVTIHTVSRRDFWPLVEGVRETRRTWWLRANRNRADPHAVSAGARRLRGLLADGPMRRKELVDRLGVDSAVWNGIGLWVDLVRVPPSGTWEQRRADLYGLAEDWVGPSDATPEQGVERLVRRYLGAFGPAPAKDIATWAGLPNPAIAEALGHLRLRRFRDGSGNELWDLQRAPLPDADTPAPVRFLPTWDATLLVHARRTQILPERFRSRVFHIKAPQSVATFLVDGQVAGTWKHAERQIVVEPFERLSRSTRRELDDEAERLSSFMD